MTGKNPKFSKGKIISFKLFVSVLLFYLPLLLACHGKQPVEKREEGELAVIERDTIQTRNFVPVVNHEAMIVNLTDLPLTIDICSPLPSGKYRKDSFLAAFGRDSMLGVPMFTPFTIPIEDYIILGKPQVKEKGKKVTYFWNNVILPRDQAVLAQYDNYYGPIKEFYRSYGMEIAGLLVVSNYTVEKIGYLYRFTLNLNLENPGGQDIDEMFFRLFVPHALALEDKEDLYTLVEPVRIRATENLKVTTSSITDGFANAAQGIDASVRIGALKAGSSFQCALQFECIKEAEEGEIYPIMTILGRRKLMRLWPPTIISGAAARHGREFYYIFYNLVMSDRYIFRLHKDGITVVPAETITQPTYGREYKTNSISRIMERSLEHY